MTRLYGNGGGPVDALAPLPDHLSYSQISKLAPSYRLSCPRAWAYDKLFKLPRKEGAALICGKALDKGVGAYFAKRLTSSALHVAAYAEGLSAMNAHLSGAPWPEPDKLERYREAMGLAYASLMAELMGESAPSSIQEKHVFTVRGVDGESVTVLGYSDWITQRGRIVDLKFTGSPRWNAAGDWDAEWLAEKRDQLATYWLARVAQAARPGDAMSAPVIPEGELVVVYGGLRVKTPQVRRITLVFTDLDRERVLENVRIADAIARGGHHPARPGDACRMCDFVDRCRDDNMRTSVPTSALVGSVA